MKRRALLPLMLLPALAAAAPPAVQLVVELRWVDSNLPPAAQAAVRDGAVVVGTAGTVSPRGPGVVTSTAPANAVVTQPVQRLVTLNGKQAILRSTTSEPLQWMEAVVELDKTAVPERALRRIYAKPRQGERRATLAFGVQPTWPGGAAPVEVVVGIQQDDFGLETTLLLPLDRWQAVARAGSVVPPAPRGTVSSRDAIGRPERELQLRVSISPG